MFRIQYWFRIYPDISAFVKQNGTKRSIIKRTSRFCDAHEILLNVIFQEDGCENQIKMGVFGRARWVQSERIVFFDPISNISERRYAVFWIDQLYEKFRMPGIFKTT